MMKRTGNSIILVNFEGRRVMQLIASSGVQPSSKKFSWDNLCITSIIRISIISALRTEVVINAFRITAASRESGQLAAPALTINYNRSRGERRINQNISTLTHCASSSFCVQIPLLKWSHDTFSIWHHFIIHRQMMKTRNLWRNPSQSPDFCV